MHVLEHQQTHHAERLDKPAQGHQASHQQEWKAEGAACSLYVPRWAPAEHVLPNYTGMLCCKLTPTQASKLELSQPYRGMLVSAKNSLLFKITWD